VHEGAKTGNRLGFAARLPIRLQEDIQYRYGNFVRGRNEFILYLQGNAVPNATEISEYAE
jgi:hypothetical protein